MKKILDINYSKINHMEKLLLDSDFYNRYKIGAVIKYGAVKSLTLGKNYKEDGKYTMSLLSVMKRRFTIKESEIFGHYDDRCGRNFQDKYCVLSEDKDSYKLNIQNEQISGPYAEGHEYYYYDDIPMKEFAYGTIESKMPIFTISKSLTDEEILIELNKVLEGNDFYFNPAFKEQREKRILLKKKEMELYSLKKDIEKLVLFSIASFVSFFPCSCLLLLPLYV